MSRVYNHDKGKKRRGRQKRTNTNMSALQRIRNKIVVEAMYRLLLGGWERKKEGRSKDNRMIRLYRVVLSRSLPAAYQSGLHEPRAPVDLVGLLLYAPGNNFPQKAKKHYLNESLC